MLDILILSALPQQTVQPVDSTPVKEPSVEQVAPQQTPLSVVQPAMSAPESILPQVHAAPKTVPARSTTVSAPTAPSTQPVRTGTRPHSASHPVAKQSKPAIKSTAKNRVVLGAQLQQSKPKLPQKSAIAALSRNSELYSPVSLTAQQLAAIDTRRLPVPVVETPEQAAKRKAFEAAKAERLKLLEQKLAELVDSEKPLKQEMLRQNLRNAAINYAKAGQLDQAREAANELVLSPFAQAELLTQIDAIASKRNTSASPKTVAAQPRSIVRVSPSQIGAPAAPIYLLPNSINPPSPPIFGGNLRLVKPWKLPAGMSFIFPLPFPVPMTSGFGWRIHPVTGQQRFHSGVDLAAPLGTPVVAAFSGKVEVADWMDGYGLTIILTPKNGKQEVLYGHLSALFVKPGEWVEQGTLIGQVGSTGLSTGPHLHFELRELSDIGWEPIDPTMQLGTALAKIGEYVAIAQQPTTAIDVPPNYATIPPPPTQKFSILHNF
jgi:murein DD-endopeptidase MepM/ murein hydrolase activator NlpD